MWRLVLGLVAVSALCGETLSTERISLRFDAQRLDAHQAAVFLKLAHQGVLDIESVLELPPHPRPIEFRVSNYVRISRAFGNRVTLPVRRVRERRAPYLHETVHILMQRYSGEFRPPTWLNEGFASYMESHVADTKGGYDAHVFTRDGNRSVDAEAREHLASPFGQQAVPFVGRYGKPPGLDTDRERMSPAFYALSQSFAKYLVQAIGIQAVMQMHRGGFALDRPNGQPLDDWKADWLRSLERP